MSDPTTLAACAYQMPGRTIQGTIIGRCGKYELRIKFKDDAYDLTTTCLSHGLKDERKGYKDWKDALGRSLLAQELNRPMPPGVG